MECESPLAQNSVSTPFELWCERHGTHPEAWWAWDRYKASRTRSDEIPTAAGAA